MLDIPTPRPICPQITQSNTCRHAPGLKCPLISLEPCLEPDIGLRKVVETAHRTRLERPLTPPAAPPSPSRASQAAQSTPKGQQLEMRDTLKGQSADVRSSEPPSSLSALERATLSAKASKLSPDEWHNTLPADAFQSRDGWTRKKPPSETDLEHALFAAHLEQLRISPDHLETRVDQLVDACCTETHRRLIGNKSAIRLIVHLLKAAARLRLEGHDGDVLVVTNAATLALETGLSPRSVKAVLSRGRSRIGYPPAVDTWLRRGVIYDGRREDGSGGSCAGTVIRVSLEPHPLEAHVVPALPKYAWEAARAALREARAFHSSHECKKSACVESLPSEEESAPISSLILTRWRPTLISGGGVDLHPAMGNACKSVSSARAARDSRADVRARAAMRRLGEKETSYPFWYGQFRKALEGSGVVSEQQLFAVVSDAVCAFTEGRLLEGNAGKYAVGILRGLGACQRRAQMPLKLEGRTGTLETREIRF